MLCLGKEKTGTSKVFSKFLIIDFAASSSDCRNSIGRQLELQKPIQPGKDQCLLLAELEDSGVQKVAHWPNLRARSVSDSGW